MPEREALTRGSARLPEDGRGLGRRAQYPEGERGPQSTERDETVHHHDELAGAAAPVGAYGGCARCQSYPGDCVCGWEHL
jgi:hypothetical protein